MTESAYRRLMTEAGEPLSKAAFDPLPLSDGEVDVAPFVERHPLESINEIFEAVHAHRLARRAVLVPDA
jgi:hypothetical protein